MAFLSSLDISGSALTAQRLRMDVVAENVANISTTRTAEGEPYRRRYVVFQQRESASFTDALNNSIAGVAGSGVRVTEIGEDQAELKLEYNPSHPDANEYGYVEMPNVELAREMVDMMSATRSYEANVTVLNSTKSMAMSALEIGRS
ncbi:flagellar basal body rod protein FlgC [Christensenellaceae bacterium OttesenSCG-928-K19]|nr:flagellar basal body rod protein FlgC [Christensenellaceae bacterium OttesenSCG-928-K19]